MRATVRAGNPPHLSSYEVGFVPVGQREADRESLADRRGLACSDEDPTEADVARFGSHELAAEAQNDRNSQVDATLARDEGHVPVRVARSGAGAEERSTSPLKKSFTRLVPAQVRNSIQREIVWTSLDFRRQIALRDKNMRGRLGFETETVVMPTDGAGRRQQR